MSVPEDIRQCVVFVGLKSGQKLWFKGTAFTVSVPAESIQGGRFGYLITAKHVALRLEGEDSFIRVNTRDGKSAVLSTGNLRWWYHPTDESVDVAVTPWSPPDIVECRTFPTRMFLSDEIIQRESIGAGDEVFIIGLFAHLGGSARNIPIVRTGNVAMIADERVPTSLGLIDAYLIEARSIGGLSGSPVFVWSTGVGGLHNRIYLLGLVHGHWDIPLAKKNDLIAVDADPSGAVNMGIAIVVPAKKILEVINQPELVAMRRKTERRD